MRSQPSNAGQAGLATTFDEVTRLQFVVGQMIAEMQTVALVEVVGVSNNGGLSPVGTVDVRPLVHQMAGNRTAVPHGIIYKIPYMRLQGGANAIILDPQVGDIGMCGFCSRDSSTVVATRKAALPASLRKYNWSDGLYIGGFLNGTPTQYLRFAQDGLYLSSPTKISLAVASATAVLTSASLAVSVPITTPNITTPLANFNSHGHGYTDNGVPLVTTSPVDSSGSGSGGGETDLTEVYERLDALDASVEDVEAVNDSQQTQINGALLALAASALLLAGLQDDVDGLDDRVAALEDAPPPMAIIPEFDADPASPTSGQMWIKKTLTRQTGDLVEYIGRHPVLSTADQYEFALSVQTSDGIKRTVLA